MKLPVILFSLFLVIGSRAATITAATASQANVQAAITSAASGDTVVIPAGSATWSSGVKINKSLTLQGSGQTVTSLTRGNGFNDPMVLIAGLPSDVPVRVTGINFNNVTIQPSRNTFDVSILNIQNRFGFTKIRIDNCTFTAGQSAVAWQGWAYGVTDHCTFTNVWIGIYVRGSVTDLGDAPWARKDYQAGSGNFPFTEDCTFTLNNSFGVPGSPWVTYHENGGRSVLRHCTIDSHLNTQSIEGPVDCHGNQSYWANYANDFRGTIRFEFYNNIVHMNNSFRTMDARGGSLLIHDNSFTIDHARPDIVDFRDEEDDPKNTPRIRLRSPVQWPCEDQITATFIYNNTYNGAAQDDSHIGIGAFGNSGSNGDPFYIKKNRDFWTKAPDSTTTTVYPAPGAPSRLNYPSPYATLQITSYTPYIYPHPLTQRGSPTGAASTSGPNETPLPPNNLRISASGQLDRSSG